MERPGIQREEESEWMVRGSLSSILPTQTMDEGKKNEWRMLGNPLSMCGRGAREIEGEGEKERKREREKERERKRERERERERGREDRKSTRLNSSH